MLFKTVKQFRLAPFLVRAFVLYLLAEMVFVLGCHAWAAPHIGRSRELLDLAMALDGVVGGHVFPLAMATMYLLDPKPKYLRIAVGLLWVGAVFGGIEFFFLREGLGVFIASIGIALFWTIALKGLASREASEPQV